MGGGPWPSIKSLTGRQWPKSRRAGWRPNRHQLCRRWPRGWPQDQRPWRSEHPPLMQVRSYHLPLPRSGMLADAKMELTDGKGNTLQHGSRGCVSRCCEQTEEVEGLHDDGSVGEAKDCLDDVAAGSSILEQRTQMTSSTFYAC